MSSIRNFRSVGAATAFAGAFALMLAVTAARAAEPQFPAGSRVGLVPPAGMVMSDKFDGFADPDKDAAILITVLPATAYSQIQKHIDAESLKKKGVTLEKREPMKFSFGKGYLFVGRQVADKTRYRKWLLVVEADDLTTLVTVQAPQDDESYSDRVVRAALATVTVRDKVPDAEELGLLPFAIGDLAGFHVEGILRGRVVMLGDTQIAGSDDPSKGTLQVDSPTTRLLIAALPGGPADPNDHANFARLSFNEIGGLRDIRITMSEPLRLGGQSGYQTMAEAKDVRTGENLMVVQWLRFGAGGFLQMVGVSRTDNWTSVLARLRTVRDSIELK
jgi:hypothetical protein